MKTIFFGTQPYDRESFDRINADYGIRIKYHRRDRKSTRLNSSH